MRRLPIFRAIGLAIGAALLIASSQPDPLFQKRYASFMADGYDILSIPPEWFWPTETVEGGGDRWTWLPVASPDQRTISSAALTAAAAYAKAQKSTALIVVQHGKVQFERYWRDDGPDSFFNPQSMSKSVLGLMVGAAIADGKIGSVNDPVERYIPEWKGDPRGKITIENLLNMASGLEQIQGNYGYKLVPENPAVRQQLGSDFEGPILGLKLVDKPGTKFDYNNNTANLLGMIVQRATGKRYADYLSEKLWKPLGLRDAKLYLDHPGGHPVTACCVFSRPRDWAQIGMLFAQKGAWNGKQVIPAEWIAKMTTPSATSAGYGYQIWVGDHNVSATRPETANKDAGWQSEPFAASDMVELRGFGFQRVWVVPSLDLVIVRAGKSWPSAWDDSVIPNVIIRGILSKVSS